MNSTEDEPSAPAAAAADQVANDPLALALGALFDEVLLPMSARLHAAGQEPFPLAPDVSWLSYYVRRRRSFMRMSDFTSASCADVAELEHRLRAHWDGLGRTELAALAGRFAGVARLPAAQADTRAELSPYVYAMF